MLARIAEMPARDRMMAERLHAIIKASAPFALKELTAANEERICALIKEAVS